MAVIGSADVLIRPSFRGFQTAARKAGLTAGRGAGQSLTSRMGQVVGKWAKRGLFAAGAGVGATFVGGVKSALDQQATTLVLTGLYDNAELAKSTMEGLNDVAKRSPLGAAAFRRGAESLAYAGVEGESVITTLENVGKTIVGAGGTADQMDQFTNGLLNGVNRGKFSLNELNQISKAGVPIFSSLAENMGISMEEVSAMASEGKIGLEDVMSVLESADTEAFQQSIKAGDEAQKSFLNTAKTLWSEVTVELGDRLQPALEWATDKFRELADQVGPALESFLDNAAAKIQDFVQGWKDGEGPGGKFRDILTNVRDAAQDLWGVFQDKILPVLKRVGSWLTDNPGKIKAVAAAFVGWKVALTGFKLGVFVVELAKITAGVVRQTGVIVANTAAWLANKLETAALAAMLAKDWIVQQARSIAGWVRETGAMVAHKAAQVASAAATKALAAGQKILNAVMRANPIGLVITAIMLLIGAFVAAYKNSETFRRIVDAAWQGIKDAASAVWDFLKTYVFGPIVAYYKTLWKAAVKAKDLMVAAWDSIKAAFSAVWKWIKGKVFEPFQRGVGALKDYFQSRVDKVKEIWATIKIAFQLVKNWVQKNVFDRFKQGVQNLRDNISRIVDRIKNVWGGIKSAFKAPWDWVKTNVFGRFKDGLKNLRNNVRTMADSMGNAWRTIANKFRNPINWVLDKVWNKGIAKAFNNAAGALKLKLKLPVEARIPAFAKGGLAKKGWALVGEEGPELVNFSQPGRVYTASETAAALGVERGGEAATDSLPAMGGGLASRAWEGVKSAASTVTGWVRGGLAKAADLLLSPIRKIIAPTVSKWGTFGQFAGGAMTSSIDSLVKWIRGKDDVGDAGGVQADISGGKWRRPSRGRVTSGYGPRSLLGGSFHAGVDYAGGPYTYAAAAGKVYRTGWNILAGRTGIGIGIDHGGGVFTYYGHNPSMSAIKVRPGDMVRAGQHIGREGATGNVTGPHLHFETHRGGWGRHVNPGSFGIFDQGGLLKPGMLAYHSSRMSKPDAVLTARQWDTMREIAAGRGDEVDYARLEQMFERAVERGSERGTRVGAREGLDATSRRAGFGAGQNMGW